MVRRPRTVCQGDVWARTLWSVRQTRGQVITPIPLPGRRCGIMERVSTDTMVRPDSTTDESTSDDTPKFFHYVKKDRIAESAVMGTHVVALCGEVFPVTRSPKPGSPVCPDCKKIYDGLKKGD